MENIHRKDLTPLEEARAFRALLDHTGWTQSRLARELSLSDSRISRVLNLLRAPREVQEKVESGEVNRSLVERTFGKRVSGEPDEPGGATRAERVAARLATGAPITARYAETSVRVPSRRIAPGVRARVFSDRIELAVTVHDRLHTRFAAGKTLKRRTISLSEAFYRKLHTIEEEIVPALLKARRKVLVMEGEEEEEQDHQASEGPGKATECVPPQHVGDSCSRLPI